MKKPPHSLFFAVVACAMLLPVFATQPIGGPAIQMRRVLDTTTTATTEAKAASTSVQTTTSNAPTTSATSAVASTTAAATSATPSSEAATSTHPSSAAAPSATQSQGTTVVATTTNSAGQPVTSFVVETASSSSTPSSTSSANNDSGSGGLSTGSIVGLSVAGGIAAIAIILFFVWKFTRKRFADFDDNEAIKWPELNAHNDDVHALPTNATGRAGFGPENDSDLHIARAQSPGGAYANSITASVPETYGTGDPYAVPPLPHLNPNQPYRDEPSAYGQPGYYDPYRGPVPNTFTDTAPEAHGTEAIPMTSMRSPGPQVAYDMQGRASPAPQAAMGYPGMEERSRTPVPGALATGRASPSPYGYGQR